MLSQVGCWSETSRLAARTVTFGTLCWVGMTGSLACRPASTNPTQAETPTPTKPEADIPNTARLDDEGPRGPVVVVGGRLEPDNEAVYREIWRLRSGEGPVCVIPTASGTPSKSMEAYRGDFVKFFEPQAAIGIPIEAGQVDRARDPDVVAALRRCSGFFFTGGDQSRIIDTFVPDGQPTEGLRAILERHAEGAVIAGTSAGAAMMSDPMIGGGSSTAALSRGVCDADGCDGVWIRGGLGVLPGWITDQHFIERGRIGRLLTVVLLNTAGLRRGLGVGENSAVVIEGSSGRVVGESGAMLVDARAAEIAGDGTWRGIVVTLLRPGSTFELEQPTPRWIEPTKLELSSASSPEQPFEGTVFAELLEALVDEPGKVELAGEGWQMRIGTGPDTAARHGAIGPFFLEAVLGQPVQASNKRSSEG